MYRDLLYFYGIDLVAFLAGDTRYTPRLLLSLIERFPEGSEFDAERLGGREFREWSLANRLSAGLINAVNSNTIATGNWRKGHVPKIDPITAPQSAPKKKPAEAGPDGRLKGLRAMFFSK